MNDDNYNNNERLLVTHAHQVVGKLLNCIGRCAGLNRFGIMAYEDGLGGFDDYDAFSAL